MQNHITSHRSQWRRYFWGTSALSGLVLTGLWALATVAEDEPVPKEEPAAGKFTAKEIEAAKTHADYSTFAHANTIVVGRISVRLRGVLESFPPVYDMAVRVTPREIIAGAAKKGESFTVRYSVTQQAEPEFPDADYIIAIGDENHKSVTALLRKAEDDLFKVARIAAHHGAFQRQKNKQLARTDPAAHPLYGVFEKAPNVAVLRMSADPASGVSFSAESRFETRSSVTIVQTLKGELEPGMLGRLLFAEDAARKTQDILLATLERRGDRLVVTGTHLPNKEIIRVAAAACKADAASVMKALEGIPDSADEPAEGHSWAPPSPLDRKRNEHNK